MRRLGSGERLVQTARCEAKATPGKLASQVEQIENDLKMEMRRPAAVFMGCADARKCFSSRDALADFQPRSGILWRDARTDVKNGPASPAFMLENYQRAVVERRGVVGERVNCAVEWRVDRGAGRGEKIHAEMNGAALREAGLGLRLPVRSEER